MSSILLALAMWMAQQPQAGKYYSLLVMGQDGKRLLECPSTEQEPLIVRNCSILPGHTLDEVMQVIVDYGTGRLTTNPPRTKRPNRKLK